MELQSCLLINPIDFDYIHLIISVLFHQEKLVPILRKRAGVRQLQRLPGIGKTLY